MFKKISTAAGVALLSLGLSQAAQAGTLHNGWNYSIDAFNDGSGGTDYEIQGLAIKQTADSVFVSVTGGSALTGSSYRHAADGNIGWTDLMFNFSGEDYSTAADSGSLFGIHFADNNDSDVGQVGVYQVDTAKTVYSDNAGYSSLQQYYNYGWDKENTMGDIATKQEAYDYFGATTAVRSSIASGTFLGGLSFLTAQEAADEGLDFSNFDTTSPETHTLKFDRSLLPSGEFIASVFMECLNDGIGLHGTMEDVPEPSAMGGLAFLGLLGAKRLRRKQAAA
ncbi:MAG: XDD3 family exosortase-dependent surface protein [Cyanobacteria bacterium P01_A01_bin.105]